MTFVHHTDPAGRTTLVGSMDFVTTSTGQLLATEFTYSPAWLANGYALGPDLPLTRGLQTFATERLLPGALSDAGPDQWGRGILKDARMQEWREERRSGSSLKALPPQLHDGQFVEMASDEARQGALRLSHTASSPFISAPTGGVPKVIELERITEAVKRFECHEANSADFDLLLRAGTTPGGARPKAVLRLESGVLGLAKFPHGSDRWDVLAWEATALELARRSGIEVPAFDLIRLSEASSILVMERFDRVGSQGRVGYISAHTLVQKTDTVPVTYTELAARQRTVSPSPHQDAENLIRRIAFTLLVHNVDDHMRNHGYLREANGWRLSPAFDINPWPQGATFDSTALAPGFDPSDRRLEDLVLLAGSFGSTADLVREVIGEVSEATRTWRDVASRFITASEEIEYMENALDNQATREAREILTPTFQVPAGLPAAPTKPGMVWVKAHQRNGRSVPGRFRAQPTK